MSLTLRCPSLSLISYYAFCSFLKFCVNFYVFFFFFFGLRKAEHLLSLQTKGGQHLVLRPGYDLQTVSDFEPLRFGTSLSLLCFFFFFFFGSGDEVPLPLKVKEILNFFLFFLFF